MTTLRNVTGICVSMLCVLALSAGAFAEEPDEIRLEQRASGLYGAITDVEGNPIPGLVFWVEEDIEKSRRYTAKTDKKGRFTFPRLVALKNYRFGVESDEHFIRHFFVRTRTGKREIWQDDSGELTPDAQELVPAMRYRVGNAQIRLKLGKIADFAHMKSKPDPDAAQAAAEPVKPRELTKREQADALLAAEDFAGAMEILGELAAEEPDNVGLQWQYIETIARSGDKGLALRKSHKFIQTVPQRMGVRLQMARWMDENGQLSAALPLLEKERELNPDDVDTIRLTFRAYNEAGREADAESTLDAWLAAAPDDPEPQMTLAQIKAKKGDHAGAAELYQQLASKNPAEAHRMFFNSGVSIMNRGNLSSAERTQAAEAFKKAIELKPDYAQAHLQLGYALIGLGDMANAKQAFEKFLSLEPDHPRAGEVKGILGALAG